MRDADEILGTANDMGTVGEGEILVETFLLEPKLHSIIDSKEVDEIRFILSRYEYTFNDEFEGVTKNPCGSDRKQKPKSKSNYFNPFEATNYVVKSVLDAFSI